MKKWIAAILTLVMLCHALPWTAFAGAVAAGQMITESELTRALQIAGLQPVSSGVYANGDASLPYRLEGKQSEYHEGMTPNETWDAGMLADWLDDMLSRDLYHITDVFTRADSRLQQMKADDSAAYARFTGSAEYAGFAGRCHNAMLAAEAIEEKARFLRDSITDDVTLIENNAERLANLKDRLFDSEKARLSAQLREAADHLEDLRARVLALKEHEMGESAGLQGVILGASDPAFSQWLHEVQSSGEGVQRSTVSVSAVQVVDANTRMSRMTSGRRVLSNDDAQDVTVLVIKKDQFAIELHGVDNQPVGGVNITIKDLNGKTVETKTTDAQFGSVVFDASNYVNDFDFTMELSIEADASGVGYRSFYIPWTIMPQGFVRRETLVLLTGPEAKAEKANGTRAEKEARAIADAAEGKVKPYISACMFNGLDILRQDLTTYISPLDDADIDFTVTVVHKENEDPGDPVLHYQYYDFKSKETGWEKMTPGRKESGKDPETNDFYTTYVYTKKWKQYLRPDIFKEERPYFVIPSTKEEYHTKLAPVRGKVDQPISTGQEAVNPFTTVFTKGFGMNFTLPDFGGVLNFNLPFDKYLPKVNSSPGGYVTVSWGSSLTDPENPIEWKNKEAKEYDRAMKHFQHETSLAKKKQAMGTAKEYYKGIFADRGQARLDLDAGFFVMGSGRTQNLEDGSCLWGFSAMFGVEVVGTFDYTKQVTIGPVPVYVNINFSVAAGVGVDVLHVTWKTDKNSLPIDSRFEPFNNLTINIRISLTATVGIGIKGLCSVWAAASGMLNIIVSINISAPMAVQAYLEACVSVGFELFWIKYSKVVWELPRVKVVDETLNAGPSNGLTSYTLFDAYAGTGDEPQQADVVLQEPEHYPALVPEALLATAMDPGQNAKVVRYKDYDFCFGNIWVQEDSGKAGKLKLRNLTTGFALTSDYYLEDFFRNNNLNLSDYSVYGHDACSDGDRLHLVMTMAKAFDDEKKPVPGGTEENPNIVFVYVEFEGIEPERESGNMPVFKRALMYRWIVKESNAITPACSNPRIEGVRIMGGQPVVIGDLFGQSEYGDRSQFNTFSIEPESTDDPKHAIFAVYGDVTVDNIDTNFRRVTLFASLRNWAEGDEREEAHQLDVIGYQPWAVPSMGFVAVEKAVDGYDDQLVVFDYYQNRDEGTVEWHDHDAHDYPMATYRRKTIGLESGIFGDVEVVQSIGGNADPSQTVFYTQNVTSGEKQGYRLRGVYMSPRKFGEHFWDTDFDLVFSDYDLSLPVPDFDTVTIGASQYLYWLSTAPRQKDTDPYIWRIGGMYYDRDTNSLSDELVIAEFTLPQFSYDGKSYDAVPQQVTLTDAGVGYISVAPDLGEGQCDALPLALYSFPITLKAHMTMQKAALVETTVVQGDFVHTDFSMMNDGNMGIGSFEVDVMLLEDGVERKNVETLHGDLLVPDNSRVVLHGDHDEVVATGEQALYRDKDFIYSPKQHDWLVETFEIPVHIHLGDVKTPGEGRPVTDHVVTNVLVPGVLGGFAGSVKIPEDWSGKYDLRLKLTRYSTYSNWLAASALAKTNPELFAGLESNSAAARSNREKLAAMGIVRLDYALDEALGKMVLQNAAEVRANGGDAAVNLYAPEVAASDAIEINCEVHDLQVDHRLWNDYYGEEMLDIILHNYYNNNQALELTCAMYLDDSATPVYVSLPYDPKALSADKTTTISLPLAALFDPEAHRSARFVFTPRGVAETADVNNEFTIYTGGSSELRFTKQPEDVTAQEGEDVSFEVEVAGGVKPYSYQWQVWDEKHQKWVDIPGFTGPTLSREDIEKKWDGAKLRCVVTDAEGTQIVSQVVTLTVRDKVPTGDNSNLPLYLAIAFVALALLALLRRRTKNT